MPTCTAHAPHLRCPFVLQAGQSHDDCAHAVGHGMFYYFMEIGLGAQGCWTDHVAAHTPDWLSAKELLKWRWLCTTGIYHSALNTLSINGYHAIIQRGEAAEDFVCATPLLPPCHRQPLTSAAPPSTTGARRTRSGTRTRSSSSAAPPASARAAASGRSR